MRFSCKWEHELNDTINTVAVAPRDGIAAIGTAKGQVIKFSPQGEVLWRAALFSPVVSVKLGWRGEYAVALTESGQLTVFDGLGNDAWGKGIEFNAAAIDLRPGTNLIALGNRFKLYRHFTIHGKLLTRGEVSHPIDFIKFAPGGKKCAVACADGHITMLGYGGKPLWTSFVHRNILGIDVAEKADLILAPSRDRGIVALDMEGNGTGCYELRDPLMAAEVNDQGERIVALDHKGNLIHMDKEANGLAFQQTTFSADRMAMDGDGKSLVLSGTSEPGKSIIAHFSLDEENRKGLEFVELDEGNMERDDVHGVTTDYLEI